MTDKQTPPDWVLIEAAKRAEYNIESLTYLRDCHRLSAPPLFRALCDMIAKYEQPPVDRKLLCAREAHAEGAVLPDFWLEGRGDACDVMKKSVRAIELFEDGFGK